MLDWSSAEIVSFAVFVGLVIAAALFGGQWGANEWYKMLSKPSWTPPNWLFPIAWTVLYLMIALAGWRIWKAPSNSKIPLLALWGLQLFLNAVWSYIFFGRKQIGLALADIGLLWIAIANFILLAWNIDRTASYLFIPYLVWVSYAALLNASILLRNPVHTR